MRNRRVALLTELVLMPRIQVRAVCYEILIGDLVLLGGDVLVPSLVDCLQTQVGEVAFAYAVHLSSLARTLRET